jgi:hypothetical protein
MPKFDEAMTELKADNYDQPATLQLIELVVAQNERIKNLEHASLEAKHRIGVIETTANGNTVSIASLSKSRDESDARVKVIEDKPTADSTAIADLDKRVTVCEGAIGSKAFKKAEVKPNGDTKPGFFAPPPNPVPA